MKPIAIVLLCLSISAFAAEACAASPREVVEARMRALNEHDLEAFLGTYSEEVRIYVYPDQLLTTGRSGLESIFGPMMAAKDGSVELHRVIAVDSFVIVERTFSYGDVSEPGVAIYEVRDDLIRSVRFVRDGRRATRIPREDPR
jgi:hypothetical protein